MTHPGPPRDIDLNDFLGGVGYHAADTELKRLGHEAARALVGELGAHFHYFLPPGRDKALAFTALEDALMRANRALAINGGPDPAKVTAGSLQALAQYRFGDAVRPADPRVELEPPPTVESLARNEIRFPRAELEAAALEAEAEHHALIGDRTIVDALITALGTDREHLVDVVADLYQRVFSNAGEEEVADDPAAADTGERVAAALGRLADGLDLAVTVFPGTADELEQIKALARYGDARARGLSDYEAREEGWPGRDSLDQEMATHEAAEALDAAQSDDDRQALEDRRAEGAQLVVHQAAADPTRLYVSIVRRDMSRAVVEIKSAADGRQIIANLERGISDVFPPLDGPAITEAVEQGGIADRVPDEAVPYTLWGLNDRIEGGPTDVGVTQMAGAVVLNMSAEDGPTLGAVYGSTSALNVLLEALSAAGTRAFADAG